MITRKKFLSAISAMASVMMFAAGPSDSKAENDNNREQNQAIVAEMARITAPHFAKKDAEKRAAAEAEGQRFLKAYSGQKEEPKSKGMPASVYVLCALAALASGMVTGSIGTKIGLASRKKYENDRWD